MKEIAKIGPVRERFVCCFDSAHQRGNPAPEMASTGPEADDYDENVTVVATGMGRRAQNWHLRIADY